LADVPTPPICEGESLLPVLAGEGPLRRSEVFCESAFLEDAQHAGCMIRTGRWKYAYYLDGAEELYDLEADPGEWKNLAKESAHRSVARELREKVIAFWRPEEQRSRVDAAPKVRRQKHWYEFSNQFALGEGTIVDARP
jgi:choline-sulfatase